ncbi:hypothetical protein FF011L_46520 [Roseimaritima multifibrata]|uniref:DUF6795 domain-containing protein n=2 Tax=Roseimaritima multifibrata TaxID=1930274 RepID=A0A517MLU1_9BACT|nr:hypothetical protein FF011L_46520 [Roseimaritima multifibrata]
MTTRTNSPLQMTKLLMASCLCTLAVGCGPSYTTVPVSGTVTVNGKPAANVWLQFELIENGVNAPRSTATTDDSGKFTLSLATEDGGVGAVPGEHVVRLAPKGEDNEAMEGPEADAPRKMRLPEEATGGKIKFTIPEEGTDSANFDF